MGIVITMSGRRHLRASDPLKPKTDGSGALLYRASASENVKKFSDGMAPRAFQLLTADMPTPASDAAAAVPPKASMTASTELSMESEYSHFVIMSSVHDLAIDCCPIVGLKKPMAESTKTIAGRLVRTREALKVSAAELCRKIDCKPNRWSQYETGERPITLAIANRLCDEYGLTLDWIYRGNPAALPRHININPPRGPKAA